MDTKIDGIDEIKRQVQQQIETEEKEYAEEVKEDPEKDTIAGFSSTDIVTALHNNESGDAVLFKTLFKDKTLYDHSEGIWYLWDGNYWKEDKIEEVLLSVDKVVELYARGVEYQTIQRVKAERNGSKAEAEQHRRIIDLLLIRVRALQALKRRRNVLVLASAGTDSLGMDGEGWDSREMYLCCESDIIDLTAGECRSGKQSDYIKTVAPTRWTGIDAEAKAWERFLFEIFQEDKELTAYIQRLFGYSITGKTTEHILPILWGQGRNGKGTLLEILQHVLGPLAGPIQSEMLLDQGRLKNSSSPTADIMALRGKRLVWGSETEEGRRLNDGKVKWLVGGDTLVGRPPFGKRQITFKPTHTLFLLTNQNHISQVIIMPCGKGCILFRLLLALWMNQ